MRSRSTSTLISASISLVLVLALLIGGGLAIRSTVADAFARIQRNRDSQALTRNALAAQLDEETGIRGYAVTGNRIYLEPYDRARATLAPTLLTLARRLRTANLTTAATAADDARTTNDAWCRQVAMPTIGQRPNTDPNRTQLLGKLLVDRYRADIDEIIGIETGREVEIEAGAAAATDRINLFVIAAAVLVALLGGIFLEVQRRAAVRIEAERLRAEQEQRDAEALRSAYLAEKRIADSLQDAIAQRPLPILPTLRFSATYVPATEETKVGGDWYDALELPNNRVLFAIGDVTGHGIDAAVTMNRARQALISSALLEGDPAAVLSRVNDEMFRQNAPLVTAVAGFADATTFEFVYSTAGHPPPLLIEPGRMPRLLEFGSLPLGALQGSEYKLHHIQSVPGAILVLYTDGAVEHSRNVIEGEELLIQAAAGAAEAGVDDPASFIHKTIFQGRPVGDDVAILTIGFAVDAGTALRISADDAQSAFTGRFGRSEGNVTRIRALRRGVFPFRIAS